MTIGALTVEIEVPGALSLKDKRHVVKSLLDGIRNKFNVSAAEVGDLDLWQRATLGFAAVANDRAFVDQVLAKVESTIDGEPRCRIIDSSIEFL